MGKRRKMTRIIFSVLFLLYSFLSLELFGQDGSLKASVGSGSGFQEVTTVNYRVFSEISAQHARNTAEYLEQLFKLFNSMFRFQEPVPNKPLTVRIFKAKEGFDTYLHPFLDNPRVDFVYLHHPDPSRRELVGYQTIDEAFRLSLNHQAFIQFLRAYIQDPPLWIREGFAVFFEEVSLDPTSSSLRYKENLAWMDTLKAWLTSGEKTFLPLTTLLSMTVEDAKKNIQIFYPQAWGFVSFLLNYSNGLYSRFLWDSISVLKPEGSLTENTERIQQRVVRWYDMEKMEEDFKTYIRERPTFTSLVHSGIAAYEKESLNESEDAFLSASKVEPGNPLPYYYLGLIQYSRKNYGKAEEYYQKALSLGGQKGLIQYARGVNAFAWNRPAEAASYLRAAIEADPSLKEKADPILKRLQR